MKGALSEKRNAGKLVRERFVGGGSDVREDAEFSKQQKNFVDVFFCGDFLKSEMCYWLLLSSSRGIKKRVLHVHEKEN